MNIHYIPIKTASAQALREGKDAYGQKPERHISTGTGTPCRHCLKQIPNGEAYLILAYRPFTQLNPYTETGPIFLCAEQCDAGGSDLPKDVLTAPSYITRAYDGDERIIYGTGSVTETHEILNHCTVLLSRPETAFVDIRSASNNCFICRAIRA